MNSLLVSVMLGSAAFAAEPTANSSLDAAVEGYEHLATVIIEVRKAEDSVVKTILGQHHDLAQRHLRHAQQGKDVKKHLESAADEIANVANEGDKRVQSIRQRLAKAGHTHHSDADTKEDYIFVNSKEKKDLLDQAKALAKLGDKATAAQVADAAKKLATTFQKAVAAE
jgi:hypothetical protein